MSCLYQMSKFGLLGCDVSTMGTMPSEYIAHHNAAV